MLLSFTDKNIYKNIFNTKYNFLIHFSGQSIYKGYYKSRQLGCKGKCWKFKINNYFRICHIIIKFHIQILNNFY